MQAMSDLQKIIVNEVRLDTTVDDKGNGVDIYKERSTGKYAITKVGSMKLAAAANISIVASESAKPEVCQKCIDMAAATNKAPICGTCPHAYDVKHVVKIRVPEPSGGFRIIEKTKEIDCGLEKASMTEQQYKRFLPHRASICESKALVRCIRDALGLASTYTMEDLRKPFIIAHIVPNLDAPEIRERLAGNYLASMGFLFETPEKQGIPSAPKAAQDAGRALPPAPAGDILPEEDAEPYDGHPTYGDVYDEAPPLPEPPPAPTQRQQPPPAQSADIYCEKCGVIIQDVHTRNGKWVAKANPRRPSWTLV